MQFLVILTALFFQTISKIIEVKKTDRIDQNIGGVVFEASVPSWQVCHKLCDQVKLCEAIKFVKSTNTCQMLNSCIGYKDAQEYSPTEVTYSRNLQKGPVHCHGHQCSADAMCIPTLESYTCQPLLRNTFMEEEMEIPAFLNGNCADKPVLIMALKEIQEKYIQLPGGLCDGKIINISGKLKLAVPRYAFSLEDGESGEDRAANNITFYMDIRFFYLGFSNEIVFNSRINGRWNVEQKYPFPTDMSQPFEISILYHQVGYKVTINKLYSYEYSHVLRPLGRVSSLVIEDDITVTDISVQYCLLL